MSVRKASRSIPGLGTPARTDLAVLHPFRARAAGEADDLLFSRWIASLPPWSPAALLALVLLWPASALAQSNYTMAEAMDALWRWLPFLITSGFAMNVLIPSGSRRFERRMQFPLRRPFRSSRCPS